jgi:hypothetical protein
MCVKKASCFLEGERQKKVGNFAPLFSLPNGLWLFSREPPHEAEQHVNNSDDFLAFFFRWTDA